MLAEGGLRLRPMPEPDGGIDQGPGMSRQAESAYRAASWSAAGAAAAVSWARSFDAGLFVSGTVAVIGVLVWAYSRIKLARSETRNKIWSDQRKLERDDRLADAEAERKIQEEATNLKERTLKVDLRIRAAQEKAEAKSLTAKVRELEGRVKEQDHIIEQAQVESLRHEQRETELSRQLREAQARIASLEGKTDDNARRIGAVEQSGPTPVVDSSPKNPS